MAGQRQPLSDSNKYYITVIAAIGTIMPIVALWLALRENASGNYFVPAVLVYVSGLSAGSFRLLLREYTDIDSKPSRTFTNYAVEWLVAITVSSMSALLAFILAAVAFPLVPSPKAFNYFGLVLYGAAIGAVASYAVDGVASRLRSSYLVGGLNQAVSNQVVQALPGIGLQVQSQVADSLLGEPSPPFEGYLAVKMSLSGPISSDNSSPAEGSADSKLHLTLWTTTTPPSAGDTASAKLKLPGNRWKEPPSDKNEAPTTIDFTVRVQIPDDPGSPYEMVLNAPTRGESGEVRLTLSGSSIESAKQESFVDVRKGGRLIQVVPLDVHLNKITDRSSNT